MKYQLPILLLLAAVEECAGWALAGKSTAKPLLRPTAKREIFKYGPLVLKAKGSGGGGMSLDTSGQGGRSSIAQGLCSTCTVLSGRFVLTYKNDTPATFATGVYIHHLVSYNSKAIKNPIGGCRSSGGQEPTNANTAAFIDAGEDSGNSATVFTSPDGTHNSGFHLQSPQLLVQYDFVNYLAVAQEIFINIDIEYLDGFVGQDASHSLKSVSCGIGGPKLSQTGPSVTTSPKMPVLADATIVWARGHLHQGGEKMVLTVNGKTACVSSAKYITVGGKQDMIMSICPAVIPVKKGDYITVSSTYDLSKHKLRESTDGHGAAHGALGGSDVMGMFAMSHVMDK